MNNHKMHMKDLGERRAQNTGSRYVWVSFLIISIFAVGCGKKTSAKANKPEDVLPETTIEITGDKQNPPAGPLAGTPSQSAMPLPETSVSGLTPVSNPATPDNVTNLTVTGKDIPHQPSMKDIQRALANGKWYEGKIDGKIGPKTKKAIEEFQKQNNLSPDGRVGPKTWEKLKTYLNAEPSVVPVAATLKKK